MSIDKTNNFFRRVFSRKPRGQGLLEVIISIGVITAGTVGSVTLISATTSAGRSTNNKVIAASLARESIEIARNIRDSNWLKIQSNVVGVTTFSGLFDESASARRHFANAVFDRTANTWTIASIGVGAEVHTTDTAFSKTCGSFACSAVFLDGNGYYQKSTGSAGIASKFSRVLTINPICRSDASPNDGIADSPNPVERILATDRTTCTTSATPTNEVLVGLQVISTIRWKEGTANNPTCGGVGWKCYTLEDRLYNWKYVK